MSSITFQLHQILNQQRRFKYPFEEQEHLIPSNGIYCIFEKGERYGDNDRIVRVGSHTGNNKLLTRLKEHFIKTNKDRSIFRKNIGRALLHKANDPYLSIWKKISHPKQPERSTTTSSIRYIRKILSKKSAPTFKKT